MTLSCLPQDIWKFVSSNLGQFDNTSISLAGLPGSNLLNLRSEKSDVNKNLKLFKSVNSVKVYQRRLLLLRAFTFDDVFKKDVSRISELVLWNVEVNSEKLLDQLTSLNIRNLEIDCVTLNVNYLKNNFSKLDFKTLVFKELFIRGVLQKKSGCEPKHKKQCTEFVSNMSDLVLKNDNVVKFDATVFCDENICLTLELSNCNHLSYKNCFNSNLEFKRCTRLSCLKLELPKLSSSTVLSLNSECAESLESLELSSSLSHFNRETQNINLDLSKLKVLRCVQLTEMKVSELNFAPFNLISNLSFSWVGKPENLISSMKFLNPKLLHLRLLFSGDDQFSFVDIPAMSNLRALKIESTKPILFSKAGQNLKSKAALKTRFPNLVSFTLNSE